MGSQSKKKKKTPDIRATVAEIKRTQDADAIKLAIQPSFEGTALSPVGINIIDWVNVSTSIDAAQSPS